MGEERNPYQPPKVGAHVQESSTTSGYQMPVAQLDLDASACGDCLNARMRPVAMSPPATQ
jgi:hypothetical protein